MKSTKSLYSVWSNKPDTITVINQWYKAARHTAKPKENQEHSVKNGIPTEQQKKTQ